MVACQRVYRVRPTGMPLPGVWWTPHATNKRGDDPSYADWGVSGPRAPHTKMTERQFSGEAERIFLPVGVARAPALYPQSALLPRRTFGPNDLQVRDRPGAEIVVQPSQQGRSQQPDLGGPCRRVGADGEPASLEELWHAVRCDLRADDLWPSTFHPTNRQRLRPPPFVDESVDRVRNRLRVAVIGSRAGHLGV